LAKLKDKIKKKKNIGEDNHEEPEELKDSEKIALTKNLLHNQKRLK
jgi:hypothetical protein